MPVRYRRPPAAGRIHLELDSVVGPWPFEAVFVCDRFRRHERRRVHGAYTNAVSGAVRYSVVVAPGEFTPDRPDIGDGLVLVRDRVGGARADRTRRRGIGETARVTLSRFKFVRPLLSATRISIVIIVMIFVSVISIVRVHAASHPPVLRVTCTLTFGKFNIIFTHYRIQRSCLTIP